MATTLDVPASSSTVRVRMIDTTAVMTIKAESFVKPVLEGHEILNITDVAFLIDNEKLGRRVLFDAGVRKDFWNFAPPIASRLGDIIPSLRVDKDITEVLDEAGIELKSIEALIWSHHHWDHTGNPSLFPSSTALVVGPGLNATDAPHLLPGYPENPKSPLLAADFANRDIVEINFIEPKTPKIGSFNAHDFFGDGSFYLLDTPGHAVGHMCGLARTTPDTFVVLGGDICHFAGDLRPNHTYRLPDPIPKGVLDKDFFFLSPCPCSLFTDLVPDSKGDPRKNPIYALSDHKRSAYINPPIASASVSTLRSHFDEAENVFVCLAHDRALLEGDVLPLLNQDPKGSINAWKEKGWKDILYWSWLNELPRGGKPGREAIVDGFWSDGKRVERKEGKL